MRERWWLLFKEYLSWINTIPEGTEQQGNVIKTQILGRWKQYFELIIQFLQLFDSVFEGCI